VRLSTEIESLAVPLLKGLLPQAVSSQPEVLIIYLLLLLIIGSALASVVIRNLVFAIAAYSATMVAVALLYLMLAPFLLFAVQLLLFTTVSATLLVGLLRRTSGIEPAPDSPFSRELIAGIAVGAVLLALVGVVVGATNWPVRIVGIRPGLGGTLTEQYVVAIAVLVVVLASGALGAALLTSQRLSRRLPR
jgi:NADH:ubiquinone oxidoreductase subunit 6 (subunit J)